MKHLILLTIFIGSVVVCNAQTQRIKDLFPSLNNIDASQYSKEQTTRNRQAFINVAHGNDDVLLYLNEKVYKATEANNQLNSLSSVNISCMEVITEANKVAAITNDPKIRKIIFIETKQ